MHKFKQACVGILVSLLCSTVVMANDAPVAVITGSSYGLGAELVARGWRIAMVDYRPGPSATKAQELNLCLVPLPTFFSEEQIAHIVVTAGLTHIAFNDAHAGLLEGCDALREHALAGDLLAHCKV